MNFEVDGMIGNYDHYKFGDNSPLTDQEEYVLKQIENGKVADLVETYGPDIRQRELRGQFLEKLFSNYFDNIKVYRESIIIKNGIISEKLDLSNLEITYNVMLYSFIFKENICLRDAYFKKHLYFERSQFINQMDFHRLKVGLNLSFKDSLFHKQADFGGADIGRTLILNGARFHGPVSFVNATIGLQLHAYKAYFKEDALFYSIKIGDLAILQEALFEGLVDFRGAHFDRQLQAQGARFQNTHKNVYFSTIKAEDIIIEKAVFMGPVDFRGAAINRQVIGNYTHFANRKNKAHFCGIKVGGDIFLVGAIFEGGFCIKDAALGGMVIVNANINELEIERTKVDRALDLVKAKINYLKAINLYVNGPVTLRDVEIKSEVDLRDSNFQILNLINVNWPEKKDAIWIEGVKYKGISAGEGKENLQKLVNLVENSRFNTMNYGQLESYFQRCGYKEKADEVYIKGKQRELRSRQGLGKWTIKILWDWLTGYGRKPARTLLPISIVIILGFFIFNPIYLEKWYQPWFDNFYKTSALRFFISLDRFLPGIDLGLAKSWQPQGFWTLIYFHLHKLFGWILIPIALSALYTRLK